MKTRTQISINPELVKVAQELMVQRKFDSFSGLLEALIREDWERKSQSAAQMAGLNEPEPVNSAQIGQIASAAVRAEVSYIKAKRQRKVA